VKRRQVLRLAALSSVALAGCGQRQGVPTIPSPTVTSDSGEPTARSATATPTSIPSPTASPTTSPPPTLTATATPTPPTTATPVSTPGRRSRVESHALDAIDHYSAAVATMASQFDAAVLNQQYAYDTSTVQSSIRKGTEDLRLAREDAGSDSTGSVEEVLTIVESLREYSRRSNGAYDTLVGALSNASRARQLLSSERFDPAATKFSQAATACETSGDAFRSARRQAETLLEAAPDEDRTAFEQFVTLAETARSYAEGFRVFAGGSVTYTQGVQRLGAGDAHYRNERYLPASEDYATAVTRFETAEERFGSREGVEVYDLGSQLTRSRCRSDRFAKVSNHFESVCTAITDGNQQKAQDQYEKAQADKERIGNC
jgi:tetratricopeptide (TPR) repeat protein